MAAFQLSIMACDCAGPLYFLELLNYPYVCHIRILNQYPSEEKGGNNEGFTKIVVLNSKNKEQINDTLLYFNSSPSLCGQTIGYFPEGAELFIKATEYDANFLIVKSNCHPEILTAKSYNQFIKSGNQPYECIFKYPVVSASSCDITNLVIKGDFVYGAIGKKYHSDTYKFYKFVSFFSKTLGLKVAKLTQTSRFEIQYLPKIKLMKKLGFDRAGVLQ